LEQTGVSITETPAAHACNGGARAAAIERDRSRPPTGRGAGRRDYQGWGSQRSVRPSRERAHRRELARLGADIQLQGDTATIKGARACAAPGDGHRPARLRVAGDRGPDGGGPDHHQPRYHLDRGFERLEQKLSGCGASIERIVAG
jgi:hypothetical protein